MSHMIKHNQDGGVTIILVVVGLATLLIFSLIFGFWAYAGKQDYKTNVDSKIAAAVVVAKQQEGSAKDVAFAAAEKLPLRPYHGPQAYGSIVVNYPKTWSAYVDDTGNGSAPVDGYFAPNAVPAITGQASVFALRIQVLSQAYSQVLQAIANQQQSGKQVVTPFALPKVPSAVGVEITGTLVGNKTGTMVVLPLRDKTLEIWTEGNQFLSDFNTSILPNTSFSP